VTVARLAGPGGFRSVVAESVIVRHQLLILNRGRKLAQPARCRSDSRGVVRAFSCAVHLFSFRHRSVPCHPAASSQCAEETKVPHVVSFIHGHRPGPKGTQGELIDAVVANETT